MLSDEAAMATGSLGMLPSASLGAADAHGRRRALYEPVHGSAPDIAGKGIANPIATIASFAMALRYSFDQGATADRIESAIAFVLDEGLRTADIAQDGCSTVGTARDGQGHHRGARPHWLSSLTVTARTPQVLPAATRASSEGKGASCREFHDT